ncbi:MAG TPA: hypothetical protein VM184_08185 [Gaiellaceae bacterium]|nr:hypothetical protein [Gaiellaceae bacterium]
MDARLPAAVTEIRSLLELPPGAELPPRDFLEDTLTTGCAYALALEGERLRIERRLRTLARSEGGGRRADVAQLRGELARADRKLAGVRDLLSRLRGQTLS